MIIILGDTIKRNGDYHTIRETLRLPVNMRELMRKCDKLFGCTVNFCGYSSVWEFIDNKLYLVESTGEIKVNNREKCREEKLRLRALLRRGEITPTQNGHMLKAFYKKVNFLQEVDVEFMLGKPAPIFADWITTVIPFSLIIEEDGCKTNHPNLPWRRMAYLHVQEGKLVETSFEEPENLKEDSWPGCFTGIESEFLTLGNVQFSEEQLAQLKEEQLKALKNAVFKISPFRFGNNKSS